MYKKQDTLSYLFRNLIGEKPNTGKWRLELFIYRWEFYSLPPTCAVLDASGQVLVNHILNESALTFTTEAGAILYAANLSHKGKLKTAIVTDSFSVLKDIRNPSASKWNAINKLRNIMAICGDKIKIL